MACIEKDHFASLQKYYEDVIQGTKNTSHSTKDYCNLSLSSIYLMKYVPSIRSSLLGNVWPLFNDYIKIFLTNHYSKIKAKKDSLFPQYVVSTIDRVIEDSIDLASSNYPFWGHYLLECNLQFLTKIPFEFQEYPLRVITCEEHLLIFKDCYAVIAIFKLLKFALAKASQTLSAEPINILISNIVATYPQSTWIYIICIQDLPPEYFYKCLLEYSLSTYNSRFQIVNNLVELIAVSLEFFPDFRSYLITACFYIFDRSISEPLKSTSLSTIPFLLHLASCLINVFNLKVPEILKKIDSKTENVLMDQARKREESLQSLILPKLVSIIIGNPSEDLNIFEFILRNSQNNKQNYVSYLRILLMIVDKSKDLIWSSDTSLEGVLSRKSVHNILTRLKSRTSELISLILQYLSHPSSIAIFFLMVSIGLHGGRHHMAEILITILSDPCFSSQHHYLLIEFSGSFYTNYSTLSKYVLKTMCKGYKKYKPGQFENLLINLKTIINAEIHYMGGKFSTKSFTLAFMKCVYYFITLIPQLNDNEFQLMLGLFELFYEKQFKPVKTIERSYEILLVVLYLITSVVVSKFTTETISVEGNLLERVLKFTPKLLLLSITSTPNIRFVAFYILVRFLTESQYLADRRESTKPRSFFDEFIRSINRKNDGLVLDFHLKSLISSLLQTLINIILQFVDPTLDGTARVEALESFSHILLISLTGTLKPDLTWVDESKLSFCTLNAQKIYSSLDKNPMLSFVFELMASFRPNGVYFGVLIREYLANILLKWSSIKTSRPDTLLAKNSNFLIRILVSSSWLPSNFDILLRMIQMIEPKSVYFIFSCIWKIYHNKLSGLLLESRIHFEASDFDSLHLLIRTIISKDVKNLGHFYKHLSS